jgi:hypothetical protein
VDIPVWEEMAIISIIVRWEAHSTAGHAFLDF